MTDLRPSMPRRAAGLDLDRAIARLLTSGTYLSVALLVAGVALMAATGRSPLEGTAPSLDLGQMAADVLALRPLGFLWLGLLAAIATPLARVAVSLVGYVRGGETRMALTAAAILVVVAAAVVLGLAAER